MSEYKEFWIQASNMIAHDDKPPIAKQLFHVIDYAAFEKLQKDWEQAATQNYADKCEIEKLKKQNEIMREALSFYASGDNWGHKHKDSCDYVVIIEDQGDGEFQFNSITDDEWVGGKRARQALKDVEGVR